MLKILRKKGVAKKILWVVAIIIIISFGFFGTAYLFTNPPSYAGELFGRKISQDEFEKIYNHTRIQAIVRYGKDFYQIQSFLDLKTDTWDRLILLHEADKRKINATDEEVVKAIEEYPFFKRNGQFDNSLYKNIIHNILHVKEREFEESVRDSLKFSKLFDEETSQVTVPDQEIFEAYKKKNEKAQVSYVFIDPQQFKNQTAIQDEQLQQYFNEHKNEFFAPAMLNVEYILLPFDQTQGEEALDGIRKKAQSLYEEAAGNSDLEEAAQKNNLKVETSGFFSLDQPNLSLGWSYDMLNQIFQLEPNQIKGPIETEKGFYILKLKEKKEAHLPEYAEVKDKVKEALQNEEAKKIASQKALDYSKTIQEKYAESKVKDFPALVKSLNLEPAQTPIFSRGNYLPQIGLSKDFQETAFGLNEENKISNIVETPKGYYILHLDSYSGVDAEQFTKEKETFSEELSSARKNEVFTDFLTRLRLKAKVVDNLKGEK